MIYDYVIDFETLGTGHNAVLVEVSVVPFIANAENPQDFKTIVDSGLKIKFDVKEQSKDYGRTITPSTVAWWKNQSEEAKKLLRPSEDDVKFSDAMTKIRKFFSDYNVDFKKSHIWVRGEMDIIWFRSWFSDVLCEEEITNEMPVMFINFREIRTAIAENLNSRDMTYCPLPVGTLTDFIKHDSLHDSARDAMMLLYSRRYAWGMEEIPTEVDHYSIRGN